MASYESADIDLTGGAGIYDPLLGGAPTPAPAPGVLGGTPMLPVPAAASPSPFQSFGEAPEVKPAPPARPAWLPEKFESPEALAASYRALEARLSSGAPAAPAAPAAAPGVAAPLPAAGAAPGTPPGAPPAPTNVWSEVEQAIASPTGLTDEVRAKVLAAGIPKSVLDGVEKARTFAAEAGQHTIQSMFGGPAGYAEMAKQAAAVLTPAEKAAVNAQLNSGDFNTMLMGAQWLKGRLEAQTTAGLLSPAGHYQGRPAAEAFTEVEMNAAIFDKRYGSDPVYMQQFDARMAATRRSGYRR